MQTIFIIFTFLWVSASFADTPPDIPFQTVDDEIRVGSDIVIPSQNSGDSVNINPTVNNQNKNSNNNSQINNRIVTNDQDKQANIQDEVETKLEPKYTNQELKKRPTLLKSEPDPAVKLSSKKPIDNDKPNSDAGFQAGVTIKPTRGKTEIVNIAIGKLNRIVTPYANPKAMTVDDAETKIDGSVVYVATDSNIPISMFISDAETSGANAISLQLVPKDLSTSAEIIIEGNLSTVAQSEADPSQSSLFRHNSPYISDIKTIMQNMGKQKIPQGFTLGEVTADMRSRSICQNAGLTFTAGQLLSGHDSMIIVLVAQNKGSTAHVFEETFCAGENVMAVAAWPKIRLAPGDKTEIFILMRIPEGKAGEENRPALI